METQAILDAAASHAEGLGHFEWATTHEPKSAPQGIGAAFWANYIGPAPSESGLDITSALLVLNCRIYTSMLTEPQDLIDPRIVEATDALMAAYNGDFDLGGLIFAVDLLGMSGERLEAKAGYLEIDRKIFRVMTINLPCLVENAWPQAPGGS
jgi:hypothetical protein